MKITLSAATTQIVVPQKTTTLTTLTIQRMVDLPAQQIVKVFVQELQQPIILWSGASYTAIGNWTNKDVENALIAMYPGNS